MLLFETVPTHKLFTMLLDFHWSPCEEGVGNVIVTVQKGTFVAASGTAVAAHANSDWVLFDVIKTLLGPPKPSFTSQLVIQQAPWNVLELLLVGRWLAFVNGAFCI